MALQDDIKNLIERMPALDTGDEGKKDPKKGGHAGAKGKLTGPAWPDAAKIFDQILAGGQEALSILIDLIPENEIGPAYKARYVLQGLAAYTAREGKEKQRAVLAQTLASKLAAAQPKTRLGNLVRVLQLCGEASSVPALVPLLKDEELCDPAAQALAAIGGEASAQALRQGLAAATPRARLAIVQALGGIKDPAAAATLIPLTGDADVNLRVTALWSLSRIAKPEAVDAVLKAADVAEIWPRNQAVKAALVLAENLAAAGQKDAAIKIYKHLANTRTDIKEAYVKEAAQSAWDAIR